MAIEVYLAGFYSDVREAIGYVYLTSVAQARQVPMFILLYKYC